jgi:hypothetical protein
MPHFRGHTQGYRDEWRRIQETVKDGGFAATGAGQRSNLAIKV